MSRDGGRDPRVLIVAEHASMRIGGEASLPVYYFKLLRARGIETWMIVHERFRAELAETFPEDIDRIHFVADTRYHRALWTIGTWMPQKVDEQTLETMRHLRTQLAEKRIARRLIKEHGIDLVHEVAPISPKQLSAMYGLGVPVVMGPMCGGMKYPPAFEYLQGRGARAVERWGRVVAQVLNRLVPGKIRADALVVANAETRRALAKGVTGMIYEVVESGVDLDIWRSPEPSERPNDGRIRFVFLGRLMHLKGPDLLLEAFKGVTERTTNTILELVGDGPLRPQLQQRARDLGIADRVTFTGWLSRPESAARLRAADVMVLPSLRECGGTAILEAMAMGVPVIATHWGGPGNYVSNETGIRVPPDSREGFVRGLTDAMVRLAESPELRHQMSAAAKERVRMEHFEWESKVDRMLEIYRETVARSKGMAEMGLRETCCCA
jgi:glycosyltransferase involved in cell wall biosynthesis